MRLIASKSFSTDNAYKSHLQSKKHREKAASQALLSSTTETAGPSSTGVMVEASIEASASDVEDEDSGDEDELEIEQRLASARRRIQPSDCLFCPIRSANVPDNLDHMKSKHSFYIPDRELLVDLPGLLSYLGEKVVLANLCLYCPNGGREFGDLTAVRKHMVDKSHCKMAYETDEDRAELADFYDFKGDSDNGSEWEEVDDEEGMESEDIVDVRVCRDVHNSRALLTVRPQVLVWRRMVFPWCCRPGVLSAIVL